MRGFHKTFLELWHELQEAPNKTVIERIMRNTYNAGLHVFYAGAIDYVLDRRDLEQFESKEV